MKLSIEQIDSYKEKGYLIIKDLFISNEIENLNTAAEKFKDKIDLPNIIRERNGAIRSVFAPHQIDESFDWLYRQERIVKPVEQLLESQVYLYQFKINTKRGLDGEWWEWHQDFPYWHLDDGVKFPNMISVMILFQDTNVLQGPLILIPGSHKNGIVNFEHKIHLDNANNEEQVTGLMNSLGVDLKYTVKKELIRNCLKQDSPIICEGTVGTCIFFHPNLFHASNANLLPFDRNTAIITYNDIYNLPSEKTSIRPDFLCSRNIEVITKERQ